MVENTQAEQAEAPEFRPSPGALLRAERERLGWSPQDVASELRLSTYQIDALEADRYDDLPGMTYVRGYLRSYARLVKLDELKVVPPLEPDAEAASNARRFAPVAPRQAKTSDRHMRLSIIGGVLLVIGLSLTWWQSRDKEESEALRIVTAPKKVPVQPNSEPPPTTSPTGVEATTEADPNSSTAPAAENTTVATSATPTDTPGTSAPGGQAADLNTEVQTTKLTKPTSPKPRASSEALAATPAPPRKQLVFKFNDTCWVDVRDADNRKLLYQSFTQGRSVTVSGKAPFRVFLGNARAVEVRFGGKAVDIKAHQTGLYARFVLGEERAAQ